MKFLIAVGCLLLLTACGTVRGTAGGFVDGVGKDVRAVGDGLGKVAEKIKP
jgi:predicted small secreted protein